MSNQRSARKSKLPAALGAFSFPNTLETGKRFHSVQDLLDFLEGEADERSLPDCMNLYKVHKSSGRMWLQCKICSSHLNFKKDVDKECFITMTINREHKHTSEEMQQAREKQLKREQQCKASRERWRKKIEESRQGTHLEELSAERALKVEMARRAYECRLEVKLEEEATQRPENPVVVSKKPGKIKTSTTSTAV